MERFLQGVAEMNTQFPHSYRLHCGNILYPESTVTAENGQFLLYRTVSLRTMQVQPALPDGLTPSICEQARLSRDARFDGLFFTAVTSTGIYCRPLCPAPVPKPGNVIYFPTAAAAATAGFRPCLRCRPERAPGTPLWRGTGPRVEQALRLIDEGFLDTGSVSALAQRSGVGERQLRHLFTEHLATTPTEVAATRRLLFAKKLLDETTLPITDIALASGYASVRRFNATFRTCYGMAPRQLRRDRSALPRNGAHCLHLAYRPPYDFAGLLAFFAHRAIPGIESVDAQSYRRLFVFDHQPGWLAVRALPHQPALELLVQHPRPAVLLAITTRVRHMFDLDADIAVIETRLATSPLLQPLLQCFPGIRVAGCWDGFEIAVRAVLGQQVSVTAARTLATRLLERYGTPVQVPPAIPAGLHTLFPTPASLANADLTRLGITRTRATTIRTLAAAIASGQLNFHPEQTLNDFVARWMELPGIGAWTAHYIAMRTLGQPDAFPAADLVLRKTAGNAGNVLSSRVLEMLSQDWRPWRAYATFLLWRNWSG